MSGVKSAGTRIRRARVARGLSQIELAGGRYSGAYISHLENGKRGLSEAAAEFIAARLGTTPEYLVTGRDPDLELKLQLATDRAIARIHIGQFEAATSELEDVRRQARKENLGRQMASAEEGLGLIAQREGRWQVALDHFDTAEALLAAEAPETLTSTVTSRARCLFAMNQLSHAIHVLDTHLVRLNENGPGDPTSLVQTYSALIGPCFEAGLRDRAATVAEEAFRLLPRVQDPEHVACLHINRAQILLETGHNDEAMKSLARAEDLFRQIGWRDSAAKAAIARATAAVETGELDVGEKQAQVALDELAFVPNKLENARALNLLARIKRLRSDPKGALAHLDEVGRLLDGEKSLEQAWRLREAGLCYIELKDLEAAEHQLRASLDVYKEAAAPTALATTTAYLGDVLRERGLVEDAISVYREGLAGVEDLAV
jgi:tetratricopeptide (TPR) repeat protein